VTKIRRLIAQAEQCLDDLYCEQDKVAEYLTLLRYLAANPKVLRKARRQVKAALQDAARELKQAG